ncbi:MAG: signal peptidase II [Victivallaceae bacterium]|nr:signal peptidase II [Victivallaceae bacterium]MDD4180930.1 signal peptidase II [Victivallaceae bacterium]
MWGEPKDFRHNPKESLIVSCSAGLAALLLIIDQVTKVLVTHHFILHERKTIIPGFFDLTYIVNRGAAWGIFQGQVFILLAIGILVGAAVIIFMRWLTEGYTERYWAIFIVLSGIIGNSIDRIWRGEVVDFLDFYIGQRHWPAFNVADISICVGLSLYFLSLLLHPQKKTNPPEKTTE